MAKIKEVFKTSKDTPNGKRYYHYAHKGGPRFWIGGRDDDDETLGYVEAYGSTPSRAWAPGLPSATRRTIRAASSRASRSSIQRTFLAKADGEPWGEKELAKEVMEAARDKKLVPVWGPETAARMMSVYASLNPDALKAPAEAEIPNSAPN